MNISKAEQPLPGAHQFKIPPLVILTVLLLLSHTVFGYEKEEDQLHTTIDTYVHQQMKRDSIPGVAVAIVKEGQPIHLKGYGQANKQGDAVTPETQFILGSMSKSFTALAIMQQIEAGHLEPEAPVVDYLPWFSVGGNQSSSDITLAMLLNHTSGIPDKGPLVGRKEVSLEEHVRALAQQSLSHTPGSHYHYASQNYQVLGLILEKVTGQSFGAYVTENIFMPMEMYKSHTSPALAASNLATGHQYVFGYPMARSLPYESGRLPTAMLISSAEDLSKYMLTMMKTDNGHEKIHLTQDNHETLFQATAMGENHGYAMGWRISETDANGPLVSHGGVLPNYRGKMQMLPEKQIGVVVLTNISGVYGRVSSHKMADDLIRLVQDQKPPRDFNFFGHSLFVRLLTLFILFNVLKDVITLLDRRRSPLENQGHKHYFSFRAMLKSIMDMLWPFAIIFGVQMLMDITPRQMYQSAPDIFLGLIAVGILTLSMGIYGIVQTIPGNKLRK